MIIFNENSKLIDIIYSNYNLLPVINRFGIVLGFKDKTVKEICSDNKINSGFFLDIINTFNNDEYFPEEDLMSFSPLLIVDYLKKTHHYYINYAIPKIETLLNKLLAYCPDNCDEMKMIAAFYKKYKSELLLHLGNEENVVFPYIINLINKDADITNNYSISTFETEHTNVDEKLKDLQNLLIKYLEPSYNIDDCNEFLIALHRLEEDLKDHARIEDKILLPQILELEKLLKNE